MIQFYISGLAPDIDELAIRSYLTTFVKVDSLEIIRDLDSGESRGYAILRIDDAIPDEVIGRLEGVNFHGNIFHITSMPLTLPGEMAMRDWIQSHADSVLRAIGIKNRDKVLDYGCGPGIFTVACAHIVGADGKVYALDTRAKALGRIKDRAINLGLENINTILQNPDGILVPMPNDSLDAVYIFDVIHDIKDKRGLLKETHRILKSIGLLSIFPMHWGNESLLELIHELDLFKLSDNISPSNSKSPSSILSFLKIDNGSS